jgi:hypothetical protein
MGIAPFQDQNMQWPFHKNVAEITHMIVLTYTLRGFVSSWEKKMMQRRSANRIQKRMTFIP